MVPEADVEAPRQMLTDSIQVENIRWRKKQSSHVATEVREAGERSETHRSRVLSWKVKCFKKLGGLDQRCE